jgi:hypothetical protein
MAFPIIFANLATGVQPLSDFDIMFNLLGTMSVVACTAGGTANAIALSPITNMPTISSYSNYQTFGFVATATSTGAVTLNISGVSTLNAYASDGVTQLNSGNIQVGVYYEFVYNSALNGSVGGFQILSNPNAGGAITVSSINGGAISAPRNLLIGGDFGTNPWQMGTSFSSVTGGGYFADQFPIAISTIGSGNFGIAKVADAPTNAQAGVNTTSSLQVTTTTAATGTGAATLVIIYQPIEANNWGKLGFGASGASPVTFSFWVKSSVNGTYSGALLNYANTRNYVFNFVLSTPNIWVKITQTIPGDVGGTWVNDTNAGAANLCILLHCGSTFQTTAGAWGTGQFYGTSSNSNNLITTLNSTFELSLVQLEQGSTASSFETLPIDDVVKKCQRFFEKSYDMGVAPGTPASFNGVFQWVNQSGQSDIITIPFKVTKRTTPSVVTYSPNSGASGQLYTGGADTASGFGSIGQGCFIVGPSTALSLTGLQAHYTASARL